MYTPEASRLLLTGTPLQNNVAELWSLLRTAELWLIVWHDMQHLKESLARPAYSHTNHLVHLKICGLSSPVS